MKIVVVSGKGGTGKTTISSCLAALLAPSIQVDCDVDASNLYLALSGTERSREIFKGGKKAKIDPNVCSKCGECRNVCRFEAIDQYQINEFMCEGCGACQFICPNNAIQLSEETIAETVVSETKQGTLVWADMYSGADGSGKLVTEIRKKAVKYGEKYTPFVLDGSPGIGCAVMASITGCDYALIVTEPTQSGLSDLSRIFQLCEQFHIIPWVCINKYDINMEQVKQLETYCMQRGIQILGKIPVDSIVNEANGKGNILIEYEDSIAAQEIKNLVYRIKKIVMEGTNYENSCSQRRK